MNFRCVHLRVLRQKSCNGGSNRDRQHQSNRADHRLNNGDGCRFIVNKTEKWVKVTDLWEFNAREQHRHHVRAEIGKDERIRHRPHNIASNIQTCSNRLADSDVRIHLFDFMDT